MQFETDSGAMVTVGELDLGGVRELRMTLQHVELRASVTWRRTREDVCRATIVLGEESWGISAHTMAHVVMGVAGLLESRAAPRPGLAEVHAGVEFRSPGGADCVVRSYRWTRDGGEGELGYATPDASAQLKVIHVRHPFETTFSAGTRDNEALVWVDAPRDAKVADCLMVAAGVLDQQAWEVLPPIPRGLGRRD